MDGYAYYVPSVVLGATLAVRAPTVVRYWHSPYVRYGTGLICLGAASFALAAPPTIVRVNAAIGVPNVSAAIVYACNALFAYVGLALVLYWRGSDPGRIRRQVVRWRIAYCALAVLIVVFFLLGDTPEERLKDFDTYYANTPGAREMVVSYLCGHLTAAVAVTALCWRWAYRVTERWLRTGLALLVVGFLLNTGFSVTKLVAVFARWQGHDLDFLSTDVAPPLGSAGAQIGAVGFSLPLVGPRLTTWLRARRAFRGLTALWEALRLAADADDRTPLPRRAGLEVRLVERTTQITDWLLAVEPRLDLDRRRQAHEAALAAGHDEETASRIAAAVMIWHAVRAPAGTTCARPDGKLDLTTVLGTGTDDMAAVGAHFARVERLGPETTTAHTLA